MPKVFSIFRCYAYPKNRGHFRLAAAGLRLLICTQFTSNCVCFLLQLLMPQGPTVFREILGVNRKAKARSGAIRNVEMFLMNDMVESLSYANTQLKQRFSLASESIVNPTKKSMMGMASWKNLSSGTYLGPGTVGAVLKYCRLKGNSQRKKIPMEENNAESCESATDELMSMLTLPENFADVLNEQLQIYESVSISEAETALSQFKTTPYDFETVSTKDAKLKTDLKDTLQRIAKKIKRKIMKESKVALASKENVTRTVNTSHVFKKKSKTLYKCQQPNCKQAETRPREFKTCAFCSTRYCSHECAKIDWRKHKKFDCKGGDKKLLQKA